MTEGSVLMMGGLFRAIWTGGPWFTLLVLPIYVLAQRAALNEPLRARADRDEKTGLLRFESWRRLAVAGSERCTSRRQPWSVLFADLDYFKRFNDEWGHVSGDSALAAVADSLREHLREGDLVARFDGEEFCVFLPATPHDEAQTVAERLRVAVSDLAAPADVAGPLTVSIGVAAVAVPVPGMQFVDVLTEADSALFKAKAQGRDRVCARAWVDEGGLAAWVAS